MNDPVASARRENLRESLTSLLEVKAAHVALVVQHVEHKIGEPQILPSAP